MCRSTALVAGSYSFARGGSSHPHLTYNLAYIPSRSPIQLIGDNESVKLIVTDNGSNILLAERVEENGRQLCVDRKGVFHR